MTTTTNPITIALSDRPPVRISPDNWPAVAFVESHDGKVRCQANTEWLIRVREHADGRRIVYGYCRAGNGGKPIGWRGSHAGYLVPPVDGRPDADETVRAIRRVAGVIGRPDLGDLAIADLPAEEI